jgi:FAD synthetase
LNKIWHLDKAFLNLNKLNKASLPLRPTSPEKKAVLVGGCFDLLHYGHLKFLERAKALGDVLIIALEPDEKIQNSKGRNPIHSQKQRAEILSHLQFVDEIILLPLLQGFDDYLQVVQLLKPHYLAVTANDPQFANKQKQAEAVGAELVSVTDFISEFSSSKLIAEFSD